MTDSPLKAFELLASALAGAELQTCAHPGAATPSSVAARVVLGVSKESPKPDAGAELGVSKESPKPDIAVVLGVSKESPNRGSPR